MSSSQKTRDEIIQDLSLQFRYTSANSVLFSQVVADKVGLHPTDNECLDYLILNGASTAGQLATLTGLTTGAVTAVIDRLERAGYVKREQDAKDRRKVLVVPQEEKIYREIAPHAMKMYTTFEQTCEGFSDEELAIVMRFMAKANALAVETIASVRKAE
jgi:DNA-binding MarR family transcriptional regulator